MARCPKTAAEAWKRLDKRLSDEEKQQIVDSDDMSEFHFSLGMCVSGPVPVTRASTPTLTTINEY